MGTKKKTRNIVISIYYIIFYCRFVRQTELKINHLQQAHLDRVVRRHLDLGRGQVQQTIGRDDGCGDDKVHEYELQCHSDMALGWADCERYRSVFSSSLADRSYALSEHTLSRSPVGSGLDGHTSRTRRRYETRDSII